MNILTYKLLLMGNYASFKGLRGITFYSQFRKKHGQNVSVEEFIICRVLD